jgi:apolipoprotein N-acyltransferase
MPAWRAILIDAFLFFLSTFAVAFSWPLLHTMLSTALASLNGVLVLPMIMALPFALSMAVRRWLGRVPGLISLAALYLAMELALSRGPLALPWPLLGHTLSEALMLNQFADLAGVPGLTLWVLLINGVFFSLLVYPNVRTRVSLSVALVCLLAFPAIYSLWRINHLPQAEQTIRAGLIQPGIGPSAWADLHDTGRVDSLFAITDALLAREPGLSLIVWPETALPPTLSRRHYSIIRFWSSSRRTALLAGAITFADSTTFHNSALLFSPSEPTRRYHKNHLVPFAEQVPYAGWWPWLNRLAVPAGGVSGYRAGQEQPLLEAGGVSFGVLICLESVFGDYARRYVSRGAELLVTLTQDGWWGRSFGYRQHLAFTRLRAIETRRAVIQVSVTGTTAVILPDGSTAFQTGWMEQVARAADVPLLSGTTFYTRYGDWLSYTACGIAALLLLAAIFPHILPRRSQITQNNPVAV